MLSLRLSIPSKTFLLGEYLVLKGGPGITIATKKRFTLIAKAQKIPKCQTDGIDVESPAGQFIKTHSEFFQPYHLRFIDPYHHLGGLGASSAQFIMVYALMHHLSDKKINDEILLTDYLNYAWDGTGFPPSGVDVIGQQHGNICYFHKIKKNLQIFPWPFDDLNYCLIHTNCKAPTYQHLKQLVDFDETKMESIVKKGLSSLQQAQSELFIECINDYAKLLQSKKLVTKNTLKILDELSEHVDILATKGCGALSSDVILLLFKKINQENVISWIREKKFNIIDFGDDVENGLEIRVLNHNKI